MGPAGISVSVQCFLSPFIHPITAPTTSGFAFAPGQSLCMPATGCLGPRGAGASPPPVNVRADNVETLEALLYPRCQGRAPPSERGPDPVRPAAKTRATTPVHAGHGLPGAQGCRSESSPCQCQSGQRRDAGGAPVSTVSGAGPTQREGAGPSPPRCQNQGDHTCACRPRAAWGPGVPERVLPLSMSERTT